MNNEYSFPNGINITNHGMINIYHNDQFEYQSNKLSDQQLTPLAEKIEKRSKQKKENMASKKYVDKQIASVKETIRNLDSTVKELKISIEKVRTKKFNKCLDKQTFPLYQTSYAKLTSEMKRFKTQMEVLQKKTNYQLYHSRDFAPYNYFDYLSQWTSKNTFHVIYDSETYELSSRAINSTTKGLTDIIFLVETTDGNVFGSYTGTRVPSVKHIENNTFFGKDSSFFVFTLKNPHNTKPQKIMKRDCNKTMMFWNESNEFDAIISAILCFRISGTGKSMIMSQFSEFYEDLTGIGDDLFTGCHEPDTFSLNRLVVLKCD
ncbi:TLDc domain-containing protein [Entamoeba marina]